MFGNLKIGTRLGLCFAFLLVLLLAGFGAGLSRLQSLNRVTRQIVETNWAKAQLAADLKEGPRDNAISLLRLFVVTDPDQFEKILQTIEGNKQRVGKIVGELEAVTSTEEEKVALAKFKEARGPYIVSITKAAEHFLQGRRAEGVEVLIQDSMSHLSLMESEAKKLITVQGDAMAAAGREAQKAFDNGVLLLGFLGLFAVVTGCAFAWMAIRSITRPLGTAAKALDHVAERDLTQRVSVTSTDEIGQMGLALNRMVEGLRNNIQAINGHAFSLSGSSESLSTVSQQVSTNAEETSAQANTVAAAAEQVSVNIRTVASSTEEMHASVAEIAKNTSNASHVATHAAAVAKRTNSIVSKLGDSSGEIGNVIKVITTIAEQTNLLALNATIEAARAGEAGKGFAVVANEVKELAKKTAKATEEISGKIGAIQGDTTAAVEAISEIGRIIDQINDIQTAIAGAVEEQAATTQEISRSVAEAAAGSAEIARNIVGVSEAAKNTTSDAAKTARAAAELSQLSADLKRVVGQFRLNGGDAGKIAPAFSLRETPLREAA